MAKYLIQGCYAVDGVRGVLKEGGSKRKEAVEQAAKSMGGTVEAVYYAFGDTDIYVILDLPDNITAAAASLVTNATGAVQAKTTVLITPEEMDEAAQKATQAAGSYRPPGQ